MNNKTNFYINGKWVKPLKENTFQVINPCTEESFATISLGTKADLDLAVSAARNAFETWAFSDIEDRISLVTKFVELYENR
ncbi:MAG: aldehyde dehydrogenase family protein, partial [Chloroflexi bacterium]|nr:aldehyde dehydrogenase family protein [Chloroflexota bacterium]